MNYIKWAVSLAIVAFPVLSMVVHQAGNSLLALLLLCSIAAGMLGLKPAQKGFLQLLREYWPLHAAMAAWAVAVMLNQIALGHFSLAAYDRPLRLLVFAPVLWIVLAAPLRSLKLIQWSFIPGVTIAAIEMYLVTKGGVERPPNSGFLPIIAFTEIVLMMGAMAVMSIGWNGPRARLAAALKIAAFFIAVYATVLSGTRGAWIAIPPIFLFGLLFFGRMRARYKLAMAIVTLAFLVAIFSFSGVVRERIDAGRQDIEQYMEHKDVDTSLGIRLQLWHASWILFKEHPLFGVGRKELKPELRKLVPRGVITPMAADFVHSHNELLFNMALYGIFGLIAILATYFVPAAYFLRDINHADRDIRTAAGLGVLLCLCYFLFGLVDVLFFWNVTGSFYCMSMAAFFACILKRKDEIRMTKPAAAGKA